MTPEEETQEAKERAQTAEDAGDKPPESAQTQTPEEAAESAQAKTTDAGDAQTETAETNDSAADAPKDGEASETAPEAPPEAPYTFTRTQVEQMEQAARQLETVRDQFVRVTAEYDNYRKRTVREKETLYQSARADTIREFLAVYDDLERAVRQAERDAPQEGGEESPHKKGLEMIFQKFRSILQKLGVKEIEALGKPFDPEQHNAVMHIEDERYGENVVSQVFQAGFLLGGKVIRHAAVQVAN